MNAQRMGPVSRFATIVLCATQLAAADPPVPTSQPADDLARRLLRGSSTQTDALTRMLAAMQDAQTALHDRHNAGDQTQQSQRAALSALDELIETARRAENDANRAGGRTQERRRPGTVQPQPPRPTGARKPDDSRIAASQPAPGGKSDRAGVSGAIGELPRRWGNLPARDRAELMQGLDEPMPLKYRTHIERYYRSLAEETPP